MEICYWKERRNWRAHLGEEVHDKHLPVDFWIFAWGEKFFPYVVIFFVSSTGDSKELYFVGNHLLQTLVLVQMERYNNNN